MSVVLSAGTKVFFFLDKRRRGRCNNTHSYNTLIYPTNKEIVQMETQLAGKDSRKLIITGPNIHERRNIKNYVHKRLRCCGNNT